MTVYNKLIVYQKSKLLTLDIYLLTNNFPKTEIQGLTSQIRRAAVSITLNIAEGSARNSDKQFHNFINIAIGSVTEVKVCLEIALDLKYINQNSFDIVFENTEEVSKLLYSLQKAVR